MIFVWLCCLAGLNLMGTWYKRMEDPRAHGRCTKTPLTPSFVQHMFHYSRNVGMSDNYGPSKTCLIVLMLTRNWGNFGVHTWGGCTHNITGMAITFRLLAEAKADACGVHSVRFSPGPFCLSFSGTHVWNNACERATVDPSGTYPPGLKRSLRRGAQVVPSAWKPQKSKLNTWWIGGWLVRPRGQIHATILFVVAKVHSRSFVFFKCFVVFFGSQVGQTLGHLFLAELDGCKNFSFIPVHTSYPKFETHLRKLFEFTKMENPKCWLGFENEVTGEF